MRFQYEVVDSVTGERITTAETTQVAVNEATQEMCFESPPILFEKLGLPVPPPL
jgi:acyl-CoA thioester hydrolase